MGHPHSALKCSGADQTPLRIKIQDEIKKPGDHKWAGEYCEGDGLGVNVYLAPTGPSSQTLYLAHWLVAVGNLSVVAAYPIGRNSIGHQLKGGLILVAGLGLYRAGSCPA